MVVDRRAVHMELKCTAQHHSQTRGQQRGLLRLRSPRGLHFRPALTAVSARTHSGMHSGERMHPTHTHTNTPGSCRVRFFSSSDPRPLVTLALKRYLPGYGQSMANTANLWGGLGQAWAEILGIVKECREHIRATVGRILAGFSELSRTTPWAAHPWMHSWVCPGRAQKEVE